jgi:hypothetical protein
MQNLNQNIMKKIFLTMLLFLIAIMVEAQTIVPVEKKIDYRTGLTGKGTPDGTYFKDVNNLFAQYIGTWKGTIDNKNYTFMITKITDSRFGLTTDRLIINQLITNTNGVVLSDTRNAPTPDIKGRHFSKDLTFYICFYGSSNSKCGQQGDVYLRKISATTMSLGLIPNTEPFPYDKFCPGGIRAEQILPVANFVTLTKQ